MKGSELIAEYLVQQKVPYVFGISEGGTRIESTAKLGPRHS